MFLPGDPLFLVFIVPLVAAFYLLQSTTSRVALLLGSSLAYYVSFGAGVLLPLTWLFVASYGGAIVIGLAKEGRRRDVIFWSVIVICLLPLIGYKYIAPTLLTNSFGGFDWSLAAGRYVVPIGISYYTFAAIGYVCDVYLGVMEFENRPSRIGLYLVFFPHVTAGPIPRATAFLPQLQLKDVFDAERTMSGIRLILVGACMKLWIADSLSSTVTAVFQQPQSTTPLESLVGAQVFAFQLYADFGGYSLIAIGAARLFGIRLGANFRHPFLSANLQEFWRSWHISLFTWVRDYVFTPLRMEWRRWPILGPLLAIQITLTLIGIWHGTGWGFLAYGAVHGVLLGLSTLTMPWRNKAWQAIKIPQFVLYPIRVLITFNIIALSLVLIRAADIHQAMSIYGHIASPELFTDLARFGQNFRVLAFDTSAINVLFIVALLAGDVLMKLKVDFDRLPGLVMSPVYSVCLLVVLYQAISTSGSKPFVYLQF